MRIAIWAVLVVGALLLMLTSCSIFREAESLVVNGVTQYCAEPFESRMLARERVNAALRTQGHTVAVTCSGDPDGM